MQIKALIQVINYLRDLSGNQSFLDMYKHLAELVKEASKKNDEELTRKIIDLKDEIKNLQMKSDPSDWGYSSYSIYEKINSNRLFGRRAAEYLEELVDHGTPDYSAIHAELNKVIRLFGKFSDNISRFSSLFEILLPLEGLGQSEKTDNSTVYLYFEGELTVQSISDLERYSRLWDGILDCFCMLAGEEKPAVDISNFTNGNIVLGVAAGKKTVEALTAGIDGIISCMPDLLKIMRIQKELSSLPLQYDLVKVLDEEKEFLIDRTSLTVATKLISEFNGNLDESQINSVARTLKQSLSFIGKGGKVEYVGVPSKKTDEIFRRNLIECFRVAREMQELAKIVSEKNDSGKEGIGDLY